MVIEYATHKVAMQRNPTALNGRRCPRPGWTSESRDRLIERYAVAAKRIAVGTWGWVKEWKNTTFDHGFYNL